MWRLLVPAEKDFDNVFFVRGVKSVFSELHMFSGKINKLNDFHQKNPENEPQNAHNIKQGFNKRGFYAVTVTINKAFILRFKIHLTNIC